jgi:hypothetical protein
LVERRSFSSLPLVSLSISLYSRLLKPPLELALAGLSLVLLNTSNRIKPVTFFSPQQVNSGSQDRGPPGRIDHPPCSLITS